MAPVADSGRAMAHIDLTRGADAVLIAPATADFLAKLAHGLADDLLFYALPGPRLPIAGRPGDEPADVGASRRPDAIWRNWRPTA